MSMAWKREEYKTPEAPAESQALLEFKEMEINRDPKQHCGDRALGFSH